MVIHNEVKTALNRMKLIEKLILNLNTPYLLNPEEREIQEGDSEAIKSLKRALKPETKDQATQTEIIKKVEKETQTDKIEKLELKIEQHPINIYK